MYRLKIFTKLPARGLYAVLALSLGAILLVACAQTAQTSRPTSQPTTTPVRLPSPMPEVTPTGSADSVVLAAKTMLAEKSKTTIDAIQVVDIQPVQWPDSCLGVPQDGIMCAMHVVDGYRVILSVNNLQYEAHSNQDGSQMIFVPGPVLTEPGMTYSVGQGDQCQTYLFTENQEAASGPCYGVLNRVPYVEKMRTEELSHYLQSYKPFSMSNSQGFLNFSGTGSAQASGFEQRSMAAWAQIVADETQSGHSSAAAGLAIGWHRSGGLAGFCDDLSVYVTGVASATSCKNGKATDLGQTWLTSQQLNQLYQWVDSLNNFDYAPSSQATADALNIQLVFSGKGSTSATQSDMQAIESFAEQLYAQASGTPVSVNTDEAAKVVEDFLTTFKADPTGKSSLHDLSSMLQADIQSGDLLPDLLGIQNNFLSFGISSTQELAGTGQVLVDVGLNFVSPIHRAFVLGKENGAWRINTFIVHAVPPMTPEGNFLAADQVILEYVQALHDKNAANAWGFLSTQAQKSIQQSDLEKEAQGFKSISAVAITLNQPGTDQLTYSVKLWVSLTQNPAAGWSEGKNTRSFVLIKNGKSWQIDKIGSGS